MWYYRDWNCMSREEAFLFNTEEEAITFIREGTKKSMSKYPNEPHLWAMTDDSEYSDIDFYELKTVTPEEALNLYFKE